jgi:hypothetical protein
MGIYDPSAQFPAGTPAGLATNGWIKSWKARPIALPIKPWWEPGGLTYVVPGAKLTTNAPVPIHGLSGRPFAGAWEFNKNSGLFVKAQRGLVQYGVKANMLQLAEFDVSAFDQSPNTVSIEMGNNPGYSLVAIVNGCYSGTPQDAGGNALPPQLKITAGDQVYGGKLAVKYGDTGNYKPVNPGDTTIGTPWYNAHENFDVSNAQSYVSVLENLAQRKAMNNVEANLAAKDGLRLLVNFGNYERTRPLMEVFQTLANSGVVTPYVVQSGVNNTAVNSLVKSYNDQVLYGQQSNPAFGRMTVEGVTGLRPDLAVIVARPPLPEPQFSAFLYVHGGEVGEYAIQTDPMALMADTVPHIAIFQWTAVNGPMFFGAGNAVAGDVGFSMLLNEGFAAVSGWLMEFLFSGSAS